MRWLFVAILLKGCDAGSDLRTLQSLHLDQVDFLVHRERNVPPAEVRKSVLARRDEGHTIPVDDDVKLRPQPLTTQETLPGLGMALLAGLCTCLGVIVICCLPPGEPNPNVMACGLGMAAGVMITVSLVDLWPKESWLYLLHIGIFLVGGCFCFTFCKGIEWLQSRSSPSATNTSDGQPACEACGHVSEGSKTANAKQKSWRLTVILVTTLAAHGFMEGLAVMVSALASHQTQGYMVMIAIAFHKIFEGAVICVSAYASTQSRTKAFLAAFLCGLTVPLGALCASMLLWPYLVPIIVEHSLILVAGIMCYVAVFELLPEAMSTGKYVITILSLLVGVASIVVAHMLIGA